MQGKNRSEGASYTVRDTEPLAGTSYYRIRQTDFDGSVSFSQTRVVERQADELRVIPNPATDAIRLNRTDVVRTEVLDLTGRLLTTGLDVGSLPPDTYLIRATTVQQTVLIT